jgi:Arc/MetJ-type ribon-helix-helix transcriptional regulator
MPRTTGSFAKIGRQEIDVKTLKIEVPDQLAKEIAGLVQAGWFANEGEIARLALAEFVHRHGFELQEQFQRDDILWALSLKDSKA